MTPNYVLEMIRSNKQAAPCVSIYLNQTNARVSEEVPSIALYREFSYARKLLENSFSRKKAADYLKPLWLTAREELLEGGEGTLALFQSGDVSTCIRLFEKVPERTVVADDFHIKPFAKEGDPVAVRECSDALENGQAVTGLHDVAQALKAGKVKQLWVAEDVMLWGLLNRRHGTVVLHSRQLDDRDGDILDDFCEWAIDEGADVRVLPLHQLPRQHALIAVLKDTQPHERRKNATH